MREIKSACHYENLESLSTQELDELLQAELRKEKPNEEVVLPILRALQERETEHPVEISNDTEDVWNTYRGYVGKSVPAASTRKRYWIINIAAVAAIACVLTMAIPNTVGAESIFDVLIRWTESVFEFLKPGEKSDPPVEYVFQTDNPGLQQLYDKIVEIGITEPVVPMWLPEGYELTELKVSVVPSADKVFARFEKDNSCFSFSFRNLRNFLGKYEKKDTGVEIYEKVEAKHFIIENENCFITTWRNGKVESSVNTDVEKKTLLRVIDSIYRRDIYE